MTRPARRPCTASRSSRSWRQGACAAALAGPSAACFVLTNTRSLDERAAAARTARAARALLAAARARGTRIQLVSRSDSTLRGHVMAEVAALRAVRRADRGRGVDAVLLIPAFLEAGRLTAGDIHWARAGGGLVPVGRDRVRARPRLRLRGVGPEGLHRGEIRRARSAATPSPASAWPTSGPAGRPASATCWPACGTAPGSSSTRPSTPTWRRWPAARPLAERAGQRLAFRTGPSFVRAMTGEEPAEPLRGARLWPGGRRPGTA